MPECLSRVRLRICLVSLTANLLPETFVMVCIHHHGYFSLQQTSACPALWVVLFVRALLGVHGLYSREVKKEFEALPRGEAGITILQRCRPWECVVLLDSDGVHFYTQQRL